MPSTSIEVRIPDPEYVSLENAAKSLHNVDRALWEYSNQNRRQKSGPEGVANSAAQVTVAYVMPALAGIPGILPGSYTVTRTVTMKIGG